MAAVLVLFWMILWSLYKGFFTVIFWNNCNLYGMLWWLINHYPPWPFIEWLQLWKVIFEIILCVRIRLPLGFLRTILTHPLHTSYLPFQADGVKNVCIFYVVQVDFSIAVSSCNHCNKVYKVLKKISTKIINLKTFIIFSFKLHGFHLFHLVSMPMIWPWHLLQVVELTRPSAMIVYEAQPENKQETHK